jgi:hypothetical protein
MKKRFAGIIVGSLNSVVSMASGVRDGLAAEETGTLKVVPSMFTEGSQETNS